MAIFAKDPSSNVDFSIDWSEWLSSGETVSAAVWSVQPQELGGPTLSADQNSGTVTSVFAAGGTLGNRYRLTCSATSSEGRIADRSLILKIMEQ